MSARYVVDHAHASISATTEAIGANDLTLASIHAGTARVVLASLRRDLESAEASLRHVETELRRLAGDRG